MTQKVKHFIKIKKDFLQRVKSFGFVYVFILIFAFIPFLSDILPQFTIPIAHATTSTFYYESSTTTVNSTTGYEFGTNNSTTETSFAGTVGDPSCSNGPGQLVNNNVYILHSGGTTTLIGSGVAAVTINSAGTNTWSSTWSAPQTSLSTTDALEVSANFPTTSIWISQHLGSTQLNSATWTFYKKITVSCSANNDHYTWFVGSTDSYVTGISYAIASCTNPGFTFTDPTISAGTTLIRAIHITELRTDINTLLSDGGFATSSFTDPTITPGVTLVRSVHITELRSALANVYTDCSKSAPTYTDTTLTAGSSLIRAIDITELRNNIVNAP